MGRDRKDVTYTYKYLRFKYPREFLLQAFTAFSVKQLRILVFH